MNALFTAGGRLNIKTHRFLFHRERRGSGWSAIVGLSNNPEDEVKTMKTFATLTNVIAFSALFVAYASVGSIERPSGVRRALQTYSSQSQDAAYPTLEQISKKSGCPRHAAEA